MSLYTLKINSTFTGQSLKHRGPRSVIVVAAVGSDFTQKVVLSVKTLVKTLAERVRTCSRVQ